MKADGLFVIVMIVVIFVAWVATGGPSRPIAQSGPFITPVARTGEESQGYRSIVPANPIDTGSYPKQVAGATSSIASGPDRYTRTAGTGGVYLEPSSIGPAATNPDLEYVSIINGSNAPVSLGSWRLASRATGAIAFIPSGVSVPAGQKAVLVTGRASGSLYQALCSYGSSVCISLNQFHELYASAGDTITLIDAKGAVVDSFSY